MEEYKHYLLWKRRLAKRPPQKPSNTKLKDPKTRSAALKLGDQLLATLRAETIVRTKLAKDLLYRVANLHGTLGQPSDTWKVYGEIGERFSVDDGLRGQQASWCISRENATRNPAKPAKPTRICRTNTTST